MKRQSKSGSEAADSEQISSARKTQAEYRLRRHCAWLVLAYPSSYRRDRGGEIVGTLLDVSGPHAAWPPMAEMSAAVGAGLRRRIGVAPDQPLGSLVGLLGGWYLAMAAVLAGAALLFAEWTPWAVEPWPVPNRFGPFATDGAPIYLLVVLAGMAWISHHPRAARLATATAVVLTAMAVTLGPVAQSPGRPPLVFLLSLIVLIVPTVVRAGAGERSSSLDHRIVRWVGAAMVATLATLLAVMTVRSAHTPDLNVAAVFYHGTLDEMARWLPSMAVVVLVLAAGAIRFGRRELARGAMALALPWLVLAVLVLASPTSRRSGSASSVLWVLAGYAAVLLYLVADARQRGGLARRGI